MTKHRKILEGVSEGPWRVEPRESDFYDDRANHNVVRELEGYDVYVAEVYNEATAKFIVHARNQWPAICDLIEAVDELLENLAYDHKMDFPKVEAALDKLNGQEEKGRSQVQVLEKQSR